MLIIANRLEFHILKMKHRGLLATAFTQIIKYYTGFSKAFNAVKFDNFTWVSMGIDSVSSGH